MQHLMMMNLDILDVLEQFIRDLELVMTQRLTITLDIILMTQNSN